MKKRLTRQEEFQILKIVLDKFLLLGVAIMAFGLYKLVASADFWLGFYVLLAGGIILLIFMIILVREYEFMKS